MLIVLWIDQLAAKQLEAGERALFVRAHQPAVAGYIGGENSGELAFGLIWGHWVRFPPVPYVHSTTECHAFGVIHGDGRREIGSDVPQVAAPTRSSSAVDTSGFGPSRHFAAMLNLVAMRA